MSVTSFLPGFGSSRSVALQRSLESRLRIELDGRGSPLFSIRSSTWAMQSHPPIWALRASVPRTSASGCFGWPTPGATDWKGSSHAGQRRRQLSEIAEIHGVVPPGCPAGTERLGLLAPDFCLWLMGFPPAWNECAPLETQSCLSSALRS